MLGLLGMAVSVWPKIVNSLSCVVGDARGIVEEPMTTPAALSDISVPEIFAAGEPGVMVVPSMTRFCELGMGVGMRVWPAIVRRGSLMLLLLFLLSSMVS